MRAAILCSLLLLLAPDPAQDRGRSGGSGRKPAAESSGRAPQRGKDTAPAQGPGAGRGEQREAARERQPKAPDPALAELYFKVADHDSDGWISWREGQDSLRLDKLRFEQIDVDGSGLISLEEFRVSYDRTVERIGAYPPPTARPGSVGERLLATAEQEPEPGLWPERPAGSWLEIFGPVEERDASRSLAQLPPRIAGPVRSFERLDLDRDGSIADADLDRLQRPVQLLTRRSTVLASIDRDGDGRISREEFYASMRSDPAGAAQRP